MGESWSVLTKRAQAFSIRGKRRTCSGELDYKSARLLGYSLLLRELDRKNFWETQASIKNPMAMIPPIIQMNHDEGLSNPKSSSECIDLALLSRCGRFLTVCGLSLLRFSGPPNALPSEFRSLKGGSNVGGGGDAEVKSAKLKPAFSNHNFNITSEYFRVWMEPSLASTISNRPVFFSASSASRLSPSPPACLAIIKTRSVRFPNCIGFKSTKM